MEESTLGFTAQTELLETLEVGGEPLGRKICGERSLERVEEEKDKAAAAINGVTGISEMRLSHYHTLIVHWKQSCGRRRLRVKEKC